MYAFWGAPALRAVATLRGSLSLGPFGSGALRHRSTSLARERRRSSRSLTMKYE
jgi:hypothetical protein